MLELALSPAELECIALENLELFEEYCGRTDYLLSRSSEGVRVSLPFNNFFSVNFFDELMRLRVSEEVFRRERMDIEWLIPPCELEEDAFVLLSDGSVVRDAFRMSVAMSEKGSVHSYSCKIADWFSFSRDGVDLTRVICPPVATFLSERLSVKCDDNLFFENYYSVLKEHSDFSSLVLK